MHKKINLFMVLAILVLAVVGYIPVLVGDYVPQDQWRAFTYGVNVDGLQKWTACVNGRLNFFILTGRPLVWIPECIEHGFIHDITDFKLLRLLGLAVLLTTMLISGFVFRKLVDSYWKGVLLAAPLVFSPGYAFMFYQGETAGGVLAAVAFALASVYFSFIYIDDAIQLKGKEKVVVGVSSALLFLLALFNYPAFAFIAFSAIFLIVAYTENISLAKRGKIFLLMFVFYGFLCVLYFLSVKILSHFVATMDLGDYKFSVSDPFSILNKVQTVARTLFNSEILFNFFGIPYLGFAAVFGAALFVPASSTNTQLPARLLTIISFLVLFPVIAILSSAPVILSNFEGIPNRHVIPGHFMIGFSAFIVLIKLSERFSNKAAMPFILLFTLSIIAVQQSRISVGLIQDSTVEVSAIRNVVVNFLKDEEWRGGRHIHILRPNPGSFIQRFTWFNSGEYAPALGQNPAHVKEMFTMALRERLNKEDLRRVYIRDCRLDLECGVSPPKPYEIVITQTREKNFIAPWSTPPEIIDLSVLNDGSLRP